MSLLYKNNPTTKVEITVKNNKVQLRFESDCGKHGTDETLDYYNLTPDVLLKILNNFDDYTDGELEWEL